MPIHTEQKCNEVELNNKILTLDAKLEILDMLGIILAPFNTDKEKGKNDV